MQDKIGRGVTHCQRCGVASNPLYCAQAHGSAGYCRPCALELDSYLPATQGDMARLEAKLDKLLEESHA